MIKETTVNKFFLRSRLFLVVFFISWHFLSRSRQGHVWFREKVPILYICLKYMFGSGMDVSDAEIAMVWF